MRAAQGGIIYVGGHRRLAVLPSCHGAESSQAATFEMSTRAPRQRERYRLDKPEGRRQRGLQTQTDGLANTRIEIGNGMFRALTSSLSARATSSAWSLCCQWRARPSPPAHSNGCDQSLVRWAACHSGGRKLIVCGTLTLYVRETFRARAHTHIDNRVHICQPADVALFLVPARTQARFCERAAISRTSAQVHRMLCARALWDFYWTDAL